MSKDIVIDLTNYRDRFGARVQPGRYTVRVDMVEPDETSEGKAMINLFLEVVDQGEFEGATIVDRLLPEHPKALFRVVNFMRAIGLPTPRKRLSINIDQWVGRYLTVDIDDGNPYNGTVKSEVRGYMVAEKMPESNSVDLDDLDTADQADAAEETSDDDQVDLTKIDL